jgi:hypothetical protein
LSYSKIVLASVYDFHFFLQLVFFFFLSYIKIALASVLYDFHNLLKVATKFLDDDFCNFKHYLFCCFPMQRKQNYIGLYI